MQRFQRERIYWPSQSVNEAGVCHVTSRKPTFRQTLSVDVLLDGCPVTFWIELNSSRSNLHPFPSVKRRCDSRESWWNAALITPTLTDVARSEQETTCEADICGGMFCLSTSDGEEGLLLPISFTSNSLCTVISLARCHLQCILVKFAIFRPLDVHLANSANVNSLSFARSKASRMARVCCWFSCAIPLSASWLFI